MADVTFKPGAESDALGNELYGQDIKLDAHMQAVILANGEAVLTNGVETVVQDIKLRLFMPLGSLFYDKDFGARIIYFVKDENTLGNRLALVAEVKRRINMEPGVVMGSAQCEVTAWDHEGVSLYASFELTGEDHPFNLVINVDSDLEIVIKDVNPN